MIGRDGPVNRMHTIRWALAQADDPRVTPLAAHLLLVLACHTDETATTFAGLKRLQRKTRHGRSQVCAAMRLLEELGLVWSRQGGHGRTATRELLFDPGRDALDTPALRALAVRPAGTLELSSRPAHRTQQSGPPDTEVPRKRTALQRQLLEHQKSQESSPAHRTASPTRPGRDLHRPDYAGLVGAPR